MTEREQALKEAAAVADQYYRQLSLNGASAVEWGIASDIRDDILALAAKEERP